MSLSDTRSLPRPPARRSGRAAHRLLAALCLLTLGSALRAQTAVRPPAVPLVTHNPYFSVWSMDDNLTDNWTRHWTGSVQAMVGMIRIDDRPYRFAGPQPDSVPAMKQTRLVVTPTRTTYNFEANGVALGLTFYSPLLPNNLDVLARPVTYVTFGALATDGRRHSVKLYFDATSEWAVDKSEQQVTWERHKAGSLSVLSLGTTAQNVLAKAGDNLRIDWGHFLVAAPEGQSTQMVISADHDARDGFALSGKLPQVDDARKPRAASDNWPVLACAFDMGKIAGNPVERHLLLAYDDEYAITLMGQKLRPYWRRSGMDADGLLQAAEHDFKPVTAQCARFDAETQADWKQAGGDGYATLMTLAFRQCLAAHGLAASEKGEPLLFPKENFSNGCISTVDVLYPSSPFFLLYSPRLLKAQLTPVLDYAQSARWKFPFAPHDLGTYPLANGQVYGGGENNETDQMPVEESGNMILMLAALAKIEGNADYANRYWPQLTKWAAYLKDKGLDPENQLCTDDFAGHLAHNTNLSVKAIEALGAYALLCDLTGHKDEGAQYRQTAQEFAAKWVQMADDGDHFRLTFDKAGTWSQKYNLVWDKILGLNLFPAAVAQKEVAYYKTRQNRYGLPLDNRQTYTKLDWTVWTATLADNPADFAALVAPLAVWVSATPSRVPLTDWFQTTDGKEVGFQARSVVGGMAIKMLADPVLWKKWAGRG